MELLRGQIHGHLREARVIVQLPLARHNTEPVAGSSSEVVANVIVEPENLDEGKGKGEDKEDDENSEKDDEDEDKEENI